MPSEWMMVTLQLFSLHTYISSALACVFGIAMCILSRFHLHKANDKFALCGHLELLLLCFVWIGGVEKTKSSDEACLYAQSMARVACIDEISFGHICFNWTATCLGYYSFDCQYFATTLDVTLSAWINGMVDGVMDDSIRWMIKPSNSIETTKKRISRISYSMMLCGKCQSKWTTDW